MSKQTAVEWFAEKVEQHLLTFGSIQPHVVSKFKQEAKAMEKGQIEEAYENGVGDENERNLSGQFTNAKQYYTETYKGGEQ